MAIDYMATEAQNTTACSTMHSKLATIILNPIRDNLEEPVKLQR